MEKEKLKVMKLHINAIIPTRGSAKASGLDLYALEDIVIGPSETRLVKTGVAFGIPDGYEIQIRPRSGLSYKTDLRIPNSPGTIDVDYTGECCVIMQNTGQGNAPIKHGERIAQAVLCPVEIRPIEVVDILKKTVRGASGFGSSGK